VSHLKERKEKDCLNCHAIVYGKYCHVCGQENIEPKETFWHLVTHFVYDIIHFDGKFFSTLKYLLFKPGFISKEYIKGRRMSYLHPIRMYVFTSAFFFLIFFSFYKKDGDKYIGSITVNGKTENEITAMNDKDFAVFTAKINKNNKKDSIPMTREEFRSYLDTVIMKGGIHFTGTKYKSKAQYDSLLASGKKQHNWLERQLIYKELKWNEKYHNDTKALTEAFKEKLLHSFPQMLFISVPFLALILQILYTRHKKYFYVNHVIYTIHLYCATFIIILLSLWLYSLLSFTGLHLAWGYKTLCWLIILFFWYKSMRKFYEQGRGKTIAKYLLMLFSYLFVMIFSFLVMIIFSASTL